MKASLKYENIIEGQVIEVGTARVTSILMNHPVLNFGYKIEADGKKFFFTGDHEPAPNIYESEDDEYEDYQRIIDEQEQVISDFIRDMDCAVIDSQYTVEEYKTKAGWGHSTYYGGMYMAEKSNIKNKAFDGILKKGKTALNNTFAIPPKVLAIGVLPLPNAFIALPIAFDILFDCINTLLSASFSA